MHETKAIARIRPVVVTLGLLLIVAAFAFAARAILQDYELRVTGLWNGVTGTPRGISAHNSNTETAELAVRGIQLLTGVVGLTLAIPRRSESALFRWTAWMALVLAAVLVVVSLLGVVGLSVHKGWTSFDPKCPLDGPCHEVATPMAPADWRMSHIGGLGVAATTVAAILATCMGARWIFWGITALVRKGRSKPETGRVIT